MIENIGDFQEKVEELLVRHRSILDSLSKYQETNAKVNRAITKTVTYCGCLRINASPQCIPSEATLKDLKEYVDSHSRGKPCDHCKDIIEEKIGSNLFYLAALCILLGLDLEEILQKELGKISALGIFNMT